LLLFFVDYRNAGGRPFTGVLDLVALPDLQLLLIVLDPVLAEALAHVATTPTE
jgi:hypothetical protein